MTLGEVAAAVASRAAPFTRSMAERTAPITRALAERAAPVKQAVVGRITPVKMAVGAPRVASEIDVRPAVPTELRGSILAGCIIIAVFILGFGGWAALAPLSSAAVAPGTVVVDTKRKVVQHLEGGIVRDILVRDNDRVTAGQVLVRLDDTQARARLQLVSGRLNGALALAARLQAEAQGRADVVFPEALTGRQSDPEIASIMDAERRIFRARLELFDTQLHVLAQRDNQLTEEIKGHEGQIASSNRQLGLIKDEIKVVNGLLTDGLALRPRLLLLERQGAEIEGRRSESAALIARARQTMGDTKLRLAELRSTRTNEAVKQLGEVQKEIAALSEQVNAAQDVLSRLELRASEDGVVVNLAVSTPGGVISAGMPLMEIVPSLDRLVIDAQVEVNDIDKVSAGQPAQVRLLAYSSRTTPTLDASVVWISADRIDRDRTRPAYYAARLVVDETQLAGLQDVRLYPGMPVEVMIVTGKRSMLSYLFAPIDRTFSRAFKER